MGRRGYVALAGALLVLLVVPVALGSLHTRAGSPGTPEPEGPSPGSSLVDAGDPAIAEALTCDGEVPPPASLPLAGQLHGARLCSTTPAYRRWTAPEPLSEHLDVLAAGLDRLEAAPEEYMCFQSDGSYHYDLRLAVDGEVVSLRTRPSCRELTVGGVDYLNSDEPIDAFLVALAAQRSERPPPPPLRPTTALDCTATPRGQDHALSPLGDPLEMVEAVSCWRPNSRGDVVPWRGGVTVPPDELRSLVAEMRTSSRRDLGFDHDPCAGQTLYWQDLLGRTAWGDVVVARGLCDTFLLSDPNETTPEQQEFWYPSHRAQRILDRLRR